MTGFSDDLDDFLGFLLGFSIQYNNIIERKKHPKRISKILSFMICSISSTLCINIILDKKNPPIRWYLMHFHN
jgi:hypothetical protein